MEACTVDNEIAGRGNGLFPHTKVRPEQDRFLEDARMCMAQRTHLLAHAPTGLGKTAVALTAAAEAALGSEGLVLFLTSRQSQHNVAIETARSIWKRWHIGAVDLIARDDMCLAKGKGGGGRCAEHQQCFFDRNPGKKATFLLDYPLHAQEAMRACQRAGLCPHSAAMRAASDALLVVADYNQMFCRGPNLVQRLRRREEGTILIIDEAHNLPSRVMAEGTARLTIGSLQGARSVPNLRHFREDLELLGTCLGRLTQRTPSSITKNDLDGPLRRSCGVDCGGLAEEMVCATEGNGDPFGVTRFLHAWSAGDDVTVRYLDGDPTRLTVSLIDPSIVTGPVLSRVRSSLIMSGTLHPPEMFADLLGVKNAACRAYRSPFPEGNRLVAASGKVSSRYRSRGETTYAAVASQIAQCADMVPGNVAVFFPSYQFMGHVEPLLTSSVKGRGILVEMREQGKGERDALLLRLREGRNLLLATVSGSFAEGVDMKDNLLAAVLVVGLPLAPPSVESEAMARRLEARVGSRRAELYVHVYPAVTKVLQAAGRAIRSERDRAAVLLLDDRYFLPMIRQAFPADFRYSSDPNPFPRLLEFYPQGQTTGGDSAG